MRRGILGGTFDPMHFGHLDVAEAAAAALALDEVLVVPSLVPPHRHRPHASAAHRFAMAALAVQDRDSLRVSDLEMGGGGVSYTSVLLDRLEESGADLSRTYFVTGADAFRDIATWKDYPAILDRCQFVAVSRPGCRAAALREALPALAARMIDASRDVVTGVRIHLVEAPTAAVSSTVVRQRIQDGRSITDLVPAAVAAHISKHGLYRSAVPGSA